ncbi:MAG: hypothetical protein Q8R18_00695 [bacterium]|nr:hypothetical protein [bacterium]
MEILDFITQTFPSSVQKRWRNYRDGIVLEDLERSFVSVQNINPSDAYLPADFLFVKASYAFARREKDRAVRICVNIQENYPGYDPSERFYPLPDLNKDPFDMMKEAEQSNVADNFLGTFLKAYPHYTFSEFSQYFCLQKEIHRDSLLLRLSSEKESTCTKE